MGYSDLKELLKDAKNLATGANDLQLKSILLDIQDRVYELQEENRELKNEIHELENDKILNSKLEYKNNAYYKKGEKTPYCSKCYEADKVLISMQTNAAIYSTTWTFSCPNCKNEYDSGLEHHIDTTLGF